MALRQATPTNARPRATPSNAEPGASRPFFSGRSKRPQSITKAPAGVQREIEQREMELMAAEFESMPVHVLQRMAFSDFVDGLKSKWRPRRPRH